MKTVVIKMYKKTGENTTLYDVEFLVLDYSDQLYPPIGGAVVSIGVKTATTGLNGKCIIKGLEIGYHAYTATHPNYSDASGSISLP